jgi:hypothetical protein
MLPVAIQAYLGHQERFRNVVSGIEIAKPPQRNVKQ